MPKPASILFALLLVVAKSLLVLRTAAFCPSAVVPRRSSRLSLPLSSSRLFYTSSVGGEEQQQAVLAQQPQLLQDEKEQKSTNPSIWIPVQPSSRSSSSRSRSSKTTIQKNRDKKEGEESWLFRSMTRSIREGWNRCQQSLSFWMQKQQQPGNQFRFKLGVGVVTVVSLASLLVRPSSISSNSNSSIHYLWRTLRHWLSQRGFQGLAAAGRTIAYGWALLIGYPRLLDKRAAEQERKRRETSVERHRYHLRRLAAEVMRLRTELAALDKEIRVFRRQIITWKANNKYNNNNNNNSNNNGTSTSSMDSDDIQEAIAAEMAHLAQLRADTQAALAAVRKRWADVRSKSPPELWEEHYGDDDDDDDDLVLVDATTTTTTTTI